MREDYVEILKSFEISPTASKVYIAMLELGKSSADKIAKKVGTYKANVYDALDRLIDLGMATYIVEGKKKLYLPTNPEKLIVASEESRQKSVEKYDQLRSDLQKIMPQLTAKYNSIKEKNIFEVYVGKKAYKAIMSEISREKPRFWKGFGNLQVQEFFPNEFKRWFDGVKIRLFSTKTQSVLNRMKEAKKTTSVQIEWLPKELHMPIVWTLFGNNLLILIYEPDIIALRIKSQQIVKTFSNQFDFLWDKHRKK